MLENRLTSSELQIDMTTEAPKHPLDHATIRIITELAAALLPHLKEAVSAELTKTVESLPINVDREVEEALSSLRRLQALYEGMADALNSAQASALLVSNELLPLSRTCSTLNALTARLEQLSIEPPIDAAQENELLRSLEATVSDWKGILKANGRAQTKELSDFSAEVADLVDGIKSDLPAMMERIFEKTLSPRTEECRTARETVRTLDTKLAKLERLEKIILAEGVVIIAFFAAIAAMLYLK